ncbi:MAG TPA: redoxin domain-containing protein [Pyrinomonadaceae bacterium]|nr:redoxin domain-containing protein [Chloracidobacterium sp.]MBP9936096.1 redoxin domain-containing protein [Pyrinomonadaceae bacterium]MBK9768047.1 redoxin domain-containing protein [Chloracidobacterium sp.]MBL0239036.1 redoxin domain-containing protein [Chloracidobacterium sp.]HQY67353.1 redoxin domain-containing protein [Pyrinomonadaceae bacterium]
MEIILLTVRLVLSAVFGIAGVAKLVDPEGSRKAMLGFGLPTFAAGPAAIFLPILEIAIAFSLMFVDTSWPGAIAGSILLAMFLAGMIYQLIKGNAPDCHCFGQLHSEPVGISSLVRNVVLFALALWLVIGGAKAQGMDLANVGTSTLVVFFGTAILAMMVAIIGRQSQHSAAQTALMRRIEMVELMAGEGGTVDRKHAGSPSDGLPMGAFVPDMPLEDSRGQIISTRSVVSEGLPTILFFISPACSPCKALLPRMNEWATDLSDKIKIAFVSSGAIAVNSEIFGELNGRTMLRQKDREFADSMNARWTPSAIFIDRHGKVASHVAAGDTAIAELVERARSSDLDAERLHIKDGDSDSSAKPNEIGTKLPEFALTAIDGREVSSSGIDRQTLIAFWSPSCPHCSKMAEDLRKWDSQKGPQDPDLLLFSDGDLELHSGLGLTSPVVLDKGYVVAATLGMHGTPSAIMIDESGRYASEIAIGAPNIWALIDKKV